MSRNIDYPAGTLCAEFDLFGDWSITRRFERIMVALFSSIFIDSAQTGDTDNNRFLK